MAGSKVDYVSRNPGNEPHSRIDVRGFGFFLETVECFLACLALAWLEL